jgi:hypothetical protein
MGDTIQCTTCGGMGYTEQQVMRQDKDGNTTTETVHNRCGACNGSGSIEGH